MARCACEGVRLPSDPAHGSSGAAPHVYARFQTSRWRRLTNGVADKHPWMAAARARLVNSLEQASDGDQSHRENIRVLLSGGDRRRIAESHRARALIESNPALVSELAALTGDEDWLVTQRALDLMEKLAHDHPELIEPHKKIFIGPLAQSDKWEIRLQIVRALPLFRWSPAQLRRVEETLVANLAFPQTFVRAWALDSLATLAERKTALRPIVRRHLREFEASSSKALQARARHIRSRLAKGATPRIGRRGERIPPYRSV